MLFVQTEFARGGLAALIALQLVVGAAAHADPPFSFRGPVRPPWQRLCTFAFALFGYQPYQLSGSANEILGQRGITIRELIGEGGMGVVYRGTGTDRAGKEVGVVIKVPMPDPQSTDGIHREYQALKKLRPGEVDLVTGDDGTLMLVMRTIPIDTHQPTVPAPSLHKLLFRTRDRRFSSNKLERDLAFIDKVARDLLEDLINLHAADLVHSDIKPANVVIGTKTALIDFGLAVAPDFMDPNDIIRGTLGFMDTESLMSEPASYRRDVFAMQRTLERAYFRDFYGDVDGPKGTDFILRTFDLTEWRELDHTPESGREGVKPQIAWVLHSAAPRTVKELKELLEVAQRSTSMPVFLTAYRKDWQAAWKRGLWIDKEELLMELLKKKVNGKDFYEGLELSVRKQVYKAAQIHASQPITPSTATPSTGAHPGITADWLLALPPPN